jgi:hypothetical protein
MSGVCWNNVTCGLVHFVSLNKLYGSRLRKKMSDLEEFII